MRRLPSRLVLLGVLVLLGAVTGLVGLAAAGPEPPSGARADLQALDQIVAEHDIATAAETPGFSAYVRDLALAVTDLLTWGLDRFAPGMSAFVTELARLGAGVFFALAVALLALLVWRMTRDHLAARPRPEDATASTVTRAPERPPPLEDRTAEIRRRLAVGDVAAACEALWWWLAGALAGAGVEASWTSRELLARTGRRDLAPPVRRLDRMIYGAAEPAVDDVRRLWRELEEAVG